ncbi:MAG: DUF3857 domain-containing protein [Holophaga sp.]|nr:DUF3857 domain-containing protein [Holophaga sp.]
MKVSHLLQSLAMVTGLILPAASPAAITAALKQPADAGRYPQAGAVVLLDEAVVTLDARGRTTTEGHVLVKVLQDRAMRQLSDQKIPFRGDSESCQVLLAVTHLPDGGTRKPEANGIMEVSDPEAAAAPFYSTARLKVISFPGVQVGAVMELKYRVSPLPGLKPETAEPFMGESLFAGYEPVLRKSLTLKVPAKAGLQYEMFNQAPGPRIRRTAGGVEYTWEVRNQPQIVPETGMVPEAEVVPRMVWTVAKDRAQLGRWLHDRFQAAARPDPAVQAKARELTAGLASPEAKVDRLALFVIKEIQGVPLGLGRVGYQPTRAGIILANRYADTRDKFVLFQSLLEAAGLSAQPVFLQELRVKLSALACLNEYQDILARVELPSGTRFYDLNQNLARLGQLTAANGGRPGLLVADGVGQAVTTPAVDEQRQFVRARWDMALDAAGTLAGRITLAYGGLFDHQIRTLLYGRNDQDRKVLFQTAADHIKKGAVMEGFTVSDLLDLTRAPEVTMTVRIPQFACLQGDMMILNLPSDLIPMGEAPVQPALPVVKFPFLVPATFGLDAELSLSLPDGYRVAYQPRSAEIRQGPLRFQISSAAQPGGLLLKRSAIWQDAVVQPAAYPALWRAYGQTTVPGNALVLLERR